MIDKYYLFSDRLTNYIFAPQGFIAEDAVPYSSMRLFRFKDGDLIINLLVSENELLAFFAKGDELLGLLEKAHVETKNYNVLKRRKDFSQAEHSLPNSHYVIDGFDLSGGSKLLITSDSASFHTYAIFQETKESSSFAYILDGERSHSALFSKDVKRKIKRVTFKLYEDTLELKTEANPEPDGKLPKWVALRVQKYRKEENTRNIIQIIYWVLIAITVLGTLMIM